MKQLIFPLLLVMASGCSSTSEPQPSMCDAKAADGLSVSATDPYGGQPYALGYPPYAVDGCSLAYVTASGDLRLRDLGKGTETPLASADEAPRRPAIAGDLVAWEATVDGKPAVRVRAPGGIVTVSGGFDHAAEPRVAEDAVVFTGWIDADDHGDTDVFLFTPSTGEVKVVATGAGQQRFADVSATHVAWTDFSEDPLGYFSESDTNAADIGVLDRASGDHLARKIDGKQAFPLLGAEGKVAYLDWGLVHPEPKFSEYGLKMGDIDGDVTEDQIAAQITTFVLYVRPVVRGSRFNWVDNDGSGSVLKERAVDLSSPEQTVSTFQSSTVFGPSASEALTLVGAATTSGGVTLRAFAR